MKSLQIVIGAWILAALGLSASALAQDVDDLRLQQLDARTAGLQQQVNEINNCVNRKVQNVSTGGIGLGFIPRHGSASPK